ncbi:tetratricopeptide repeat protein [Vaginella massiliensis]|uniref:tetratricopeptide repeat protein n=1 Tax=Vaginella massiliensis TaxID=1816680 RepID=UPI003751D02B
MNSNNRKYYFQALDNFPYNMEETIEALNYALSYDEKDSDCLVLMGKVYAEVMEDYETAKEYFQLAMDYNLNNVKIYAPYAECLILNEDFEEAEKLIDFAMSIKGVDKAGVWLNKAKLADIRDQSKRLINRYIKEAKLFAKVNDQLEAVENYESFIDRKYPRSMPAKKKMVAKKKPTN